MKSGSLRGNAGAAEGHAPPAARRARRTIALADAAAARASATGDELGLGGQRAEHAVEHRAERRRVDVADDGDLQVVAREHALRVGLADRRR